MPWLVLRVKGIVVCCGVRRFPTTECSDVHGWRWGRGWVRSLWWQGAVVVVIAILCMVYHRIVAKMLNGFGGRFKSFKLGGMIGSCRPNPHCQFNEVIVENSSLWFGDATEETVSISVALVSDSFVKFRLFGELFRCDLGSFESCSMKDTFESNESIEILEAVLSFRNEIQ